MNETEIRQKVVTIAQTYLGVYEGSEQHKAIVDTYNERTPLPRGYRVKYTDAWCATFTSAVAIKAGVAAIVPIECSCSELIRLAKQAGTWVEDDAHVPEPADLILYDWQDDGKGDCTGAPDHVGIVERVTNGKTLTIIEGNYKDAVTRRMLTVDSRSIRGYICPRYSVAATKDPEEITVQNAVKDIGLTSPDYWLAVLRGERAASARNIKSLMDKYHKALQ